MTNKIPTPLRGAALAMGLVLVGGLLAAAAPAPQANAPAAAPKATEAWPINDDVDDPAVWGKVFPDHYKLYMMTVDQTRTKYGGSEALPHAPSQADPRTVVSRSKSDEDAGLRAIWAGYAFAADFREERGHAYMLDDQKYTQRQVVVKQPGTCLNCHASTYLAYKRLGEGNPTRGFEKINQMTYPEAVKNVQHPVACIDCHNPADMSLRVTKPAFMEGMKAYKAGLGVKDYDVNRDAKPNEMRAYVCGQCHVEYHFKGAEKRLVYPWSKGLTVDAAMDYYDETGFRDWTHKDTGAPALKAQHPEFEMWSQGVHARAGVTCSDCHMPKTEYNGSVVSDHWVRSPLLNIKNACLACHVKHDSNVTADELKARVEQIQDRTWNLRQKAMTATVALIDDLKAAKAAGKPDAELKTAQYMQRRAQFFLDYVEAENSTGFHAGQEAARILGESLDYARQGQIALRDPAFKPTVKVVDIPPPPAPPAPASAK